MGGCIQDLKRHAGTRVRGGNRIFFRTVDDSSEIFLFLARAVRKDSHRNELSPVLEHDVAKLAALAAARHLRNNCSGGVYALPTKYYNELLGAGSVRSIRVTSTPSKRPRQRCERPPA